MLQQYYFNLQDHKGQNAQNPSSSSHGIHTHNFKDLKKLVREINKRGRKRKRDLLKEVGDMFSTKVNFPAYKRSLPAFLVFLNEFDHIHGPKL